MKTSKFEEFVKVGNFTKGDRDAMFLVATGVAGEAGEVCDMLKKHLLHGKDLDRDALKLELGDVLWYVVHGCNTFKIPLQEVIQANVVKLCDRYPNQYGNPEDWIDGDFAGKIGGEDPLDELKRTMVAFNNALLRVRDTDGTATIDVVTPNQEVSGELYEGCRLSFVTGDMPVASVEEGDVVEAQDAGGFLDTANEMTG